MRKRLDLDMVIWAFLLLLFFFARFYNLTIIPIFGDEAIYLNWSQTIAEDPSQLFIPLSDGKQPLFMWFTSHLTYLPINPLVAARFVSIMAGLFSMIGMFLLAKTFLGKKAGYVAALFYIVTPVLLFYDRLGVPDGLLATFGIWSLYAGIQVVRNPSIANTLFLSFLLGLGLLTKSPAIFYIVLLPSLIFLTDHVKNTSYRKIARLLYSLAIASIIGLAISSILRLSPLYSVIGERTNDFVFSPMHLLENPLDPFVTRIAEVSGWLVGYLTLPLLVFAFCGIALGLLRKQKEILVFALWFLIPLLLEMALAKGFTPRYFLFTIPPLMLIAASGFYCVFTYMQHKGKLLRYIMFLPLLAPTQFTYLLVTQPEHAPIPQKERTGYLEDWTAGYGIYEVAQFVRALPQDQKILVGTEGRFGTLPDGLIAYTRRTPNIRVEGMGQPVHIDKIPGQLTMWLAQSPQNRAFLVANKSRMQITNELERLQLLNEYQKPSGPRGQDSLVFYEVLR